MAMLKQEMNDACSSVDRDPVFRSGLNGGVQAAYEDHRCSPSRKRGTHISAESKQVIT